MANYGVRRSEAQMDVVDTLLALGLNREMATMSIPYVWFRVATTDPYSPVTIGMVHAIQKNLSEMGIKTRADGFVDGYTSAALKRIVGDDWKTEYWLNVIDDVIYARAAGLPAKEKAMGYLGNDEGGHYATFGQAGRMAGPPFWCSDKSPQTNCKAVKNICKPMDSHTLDLIKGLQRQANKVLNVAKKTLLDVDGRVGPLTTSAVNAILGTNFSHCDEVMARINSLLTSMATNAASFAAVPDPSRPGGSKPSIAGPGGTVIHPPAEGGFTQFVKSPIGMASMAGAVVLFLVMTQDKKKAKKKKPRRKRRLAKKRITTAYY